MSNVSRITVSLGARSYEVVVGAGLLAHAAEYIAPVLPSPRVVVVSDETVAATYATTLMTQLARADIQVQLITIPAGEQSKRFAVLESLCEQILALAPDRKTTLIALGGGVVGDLVGFAASILLRGLPFIQIPTSLLAQVDSSVGGKTAINAKAGKNLIGSFYQPQLVLADTDTLSSLPLRERRAGYAEIIKYGLIMDAAFYRWCLSNGRALLEGDATALREAIAQSCRMKAEIVAADEREADKRALLNFGHTFAHALEAETGMGSTLLHGEAVAIGMVMACRLSTAMGLMDDTLGDELAAHFTQLGMPSSVGAVAHAWNAERIAAHFVSDKKAEQGTLTFVVLDALGKARVAKAVDPALALRVVKDCLSA